VMPTAPQPSYHRHPRSIDGAADVDSLLTLAERIEHPTNADLGRRARLLADLNSEVVAVATRYGVDASRLESVVDQLSRSVRSGHVMSISGLVRQTRMFCSRILD
jgi:hypothetical protein